MKKVNIFLIIFAIANLFLSCANAYAYAAEGGPMNLAVAFGCMIASIWCFISFVHD